MAYYVSWTVVQNGGVSEPHLDVGDIDQVFEGVGGGRGSKGVQAQSIHRDASGGPVPLQQLADPIAGDGQVHQPGAVVADGPEQRPRPIIPMPGGD